MDLRRRMTPTAIAHLDHAPGRKVASVAAHANAVYRASIRRSATERILTRSMPAA